MARRCISKGEPPLDALLTRSWLEPPYLLPDRCQHLRKVLRRIEGLFRDQTGQYGSQAHPSEEQDRETNQEIIHEPVHRSNLSYLSALPRKPFPRRLAPIRECQASRERHVCARLLLC